MDCRLNEIMNAKPVNSMNVKLHDRTYEILLKMEELTKKSKAELIDIAIERMRKDL